MKITTCFLFLLLMAGMGCQQASKEAQNDTNEKIFFDLENYIQQEIKQLEHLKPSVKKTVAINDQTETKELSGLNYNRELEIFRNADINRQDWFDKYRADSTFQDNQLTAVQYTALEDKLRTRLLKVDFEKGAVAKIYIENGAKNMAAGSEQQLTYEPGNGYHIESLQHTALAKDKRFRIDVKFLD